ncbi:hypothetical protein BDB00DRAFT_876886 [Zychaea mexicana]|uniref:uncharacterized protein n=1 Tax=Zychaea mexicana TaxID=64656 RepID=UPI0022FDDFDE|nr:uncharacterized protein BDB00DRAFT_876886 [Zychaea mexicana]KAI9489003.1 hypothetical protein BDB00DRAFT_876886 [Zychaea mexicana]
MSEDNHHDGNNDTEERKPLLASPDQEVASLHKSCANHSQKQSWFATSCSVKGFSFVFLLCIFPLLLCWCGSQNAEKEHPLKHIDVCSIAPSLTWSSAHTIAANLYSNLRVGHEITDRLHVIGGLVQVQVNNQVSEPTVRFDLKLTDASQLDLIQIKQITQSDRIAILIDAKRPLCTVLNILVELPTPTALDELVIETSESSIEIDDGMHFSESIKLGTVNGNITIWDSTGNVMELTTHAGHISCSIQEIPIITQITARSTTGKIVFDYTGDPSSSKALVDQQRKISVNLTTVSGDIDAQMKEQKKVTATSSTQIAAT